MRHIWKSSVPRNDHFFLRFETLMGIVAAARRNRRSM